MNFFNPNFIFRPRDIVDSKNPEYPRIYNNLHRCPLFRKIIQENSANLFYFENSHFPKLIGCVILQFPGFRFRKRKRQGKKEIYQFSKDDWVQAGYELDLLQEAIDRGLILEFGEANFGIFRDTALELIKTLLAKSL
jgi:hypothetical protein